MKLQPKYADLILNLLVAVAISLVVNFSYVLLMLVDLNSDNQPRPAGERIVERTDEGVLAVHPDGYGYLVYENGDSVYVPSRRMRWLGIAPGDRILSLDGHPWDGDVCRFLLDPDPLDGTVCGIGTASGQHVVLTIETMK